MSDHARHDRDAHPGAARPPAVVDVPLDGRDRPRHRLDPRRARGDDRRVASRRSSPRTAAGSRLGRARSASRPPSYVAGACLGALVLRPADRPVRAQEALPASRSAVYIVATVATAFAFAAWYFYVARFVTGAGIGGEYAAINSAIDELIPARVRGRVDLMINGSYWLGAVAGRPLALVFLDTTFRRRRRLAAALRRSAPCSGSRSCSCAATSPRARAGSSSTAARTRPSGSSPTIERDVAEKTGQELEEPDETIEVRQREVIPFREIARDGVQQVPAARGALPRALRRPGLHLQRRSPSIWGRSSQHFFGVSAAFVPVFVIVFAAGNFLGPLMLGRLFDTVGRKPMITITYLGSAAVGGGHGRALRQRVDSPRSGHSRPSSW